MIRLVSNTVLYAGVHYLNGPNGVVDLDGNPKDLPEDFPEHMIDYGDDGEDGTGDNGGAGDTVVDKPKKPKKPRK